MKPARARAALLIDDIRDFETPGDLLCGAGARRLYEDLAAAGLNVPAAPPARGDAADPAAVARRAAAVAGRRFPALRLRLELEHAGLLLLPAVDLETALAELLANAAESRGDRPDRPVSALLATAPGSAGRLDLVVQDDGEGMPGDLMARAHMPMVTTKPHRLGLGLARVASLLDRPGMGLSLAAAPAGGVRAVLGGVAAAAEGGAGLFAGRLERDLIGRPR